MLDHNILKKRSAVLILLLAVLLVLIFHVEVSAESLEKFDSTSTTELQALSEDISEDGFQVNAELSDIETTDTELDEFETDVVETDDYSESETSGLIVVTDNEEISAVTESSVIIQPEQSELDVLDNTDSIESQLTDVDILTTEENNEVDSLYNKIKNSGYVSERWSLAQQFKRLYPSDSRVQEVIDFAGTSMLNYGVSLHQAGNYNQAISYYNAALSDSSISLSIREKANGYKAQALLGSKLETSDSLYNKIKNSGYVSERWSLAQQFKRLYPSDSRVQAGNYNQAISYYNAALSDSSISLSIREKANGYKALAIKNEKINKVVYLDPGHGGRDSGAYYGGIREETLNLKISNLIKAGMEKLGYEVIMSRTKDIYIDLLERARDANNKNPDIFVSVHNNAMPNNSSVNGIMTYYYKYYPEWQPVINPEMHNDPTRIEQSRQLADAIQKSLILATGARDLGLRRNTFAVLRETKMPAVLLELGFMSNPTELSKLNTTSYQTILANAVVKGIHNHFTK